MIFLGKRAEKDFFQSTEEEVLRGGSGSNPVEISPSSREREKETAVEREEKGLGLRLWGEKGFPNLQWRKRRNIARSSIPQNKKENFEKKKRKREGLRKGGTPQKEREKFAYAPKREEDSEKEGSIPTQNMRMRWVFFGVGESFLL